MSLVSTSHEPHPAHRLRQDIYDNMYRKEEDGARFLTVRQLERIWPRKLPDLMKYIGFRNNALWTGTQHLFIMNRDLKRFTCILCWIYARDFEDCMFKLADLVLSAISRSSNPLDDGSLPLDEHVAIQNFGKELGEKFFESQFLFVPVTIETSRNEPVEHELRRLRWPFTQSEEPLAAGGYSDVYKVAIAPGQLKTGPNSDNPQDEVIAVKKLRKNVDWMRESRSLNILREKMMTHKRLSLNLCAIRKGSDYFIFFDFTPLGDLEVFLKEGHIVNDASEDCVMYDFPAWFPNFNGLDDLVKEFTNLTHAVNYLHKELERLAVLPVHCAHVDLRPKNILVFPPDANNPVGVWKVSDFGISSFILDNSQLTSEQSGGNSLHSSAVGGLSVSEAHDSAADTTTRELRGPHRAPEHFLSGYESDPRCSDVWALGCMLCEIMVFGIAVNPGYRHRWRALKQFREARRHYQHIHEDSNFHYRGYWDGSEHTQEVIANAPLKFVLRLEVREKLNHYERVSEYADLCRAIRLMLHPDPRHRITADDAHTFLNALCSQHHTNLERLRSCPFQKDPSWSVRCKVLTNNAGIEKTHFIGHVDSVDMNSRRTSEGRFAQSEPDILGETAGIISFATGQKLIMDLPQRVVVDASGSAPLTLLSRDGDRFYRLDVKKHKFTRQPPESWLECRVSQGSKAAHKLTEDANWHSIDESPECVALVGTPQRRPGECILTVLHRAQDKLEPMTTKFTANHIQQARKVICGAGGYVALLNKSQVYVWQHNAQNVDSLPKPSGDFMIEDSVFSAESSYLFVWWTSPSGDRLVVYSCATGCAPRHFAEFQWDDTRRRDSRSCMVPCADLPGCIIFRKDEPVRTIFAQSRSPLVREAYKQENLDLQGVSISRGLIHATHSHLFLFIEQQKVRGFRLKPEISNQKVVIHIENEPMFTDRPAFPRPITGLAARIGATVPSTSHIRVVDDRCAMWEAKIELVED